MVEPDTSHFSVAQQSIWDKAADLEKKLAGGNNFATVQEEMED